MRVGSDRFEIVLVRKKGIRSADEVAAQVRTPWRPPHIPARESCAAAAFRNRLRSGPGTPRSRSILPHNFVFARAYRMSSPNSLNVFKLARVFSSSRMAERIEFPHGGLGPRPSKAQSNLPVAEHDSS